MNDPGDRIPAILADIGCAVEGEEVDQLAVFGFGDGDAFGGGSS